MLLLHPSTFCSIILLVFAFSFSAFAYENTQNESLEFVKWSQDLNADFNKGFESFNVSSIDPLRKAFRPVSIDLGSFDDSNQTLVLSVQLIKGLSQRIVRSDLSVSPLDNNNTFSVKWLVDYVEIELEGNYNVWSQNDSFQKATGRFKYVIEGGIFSEVGLFSVNGKRGRKYDFKGQSINMINIENNKGYLILSDERGNMIQNYALNSRRNEVNTRRKIEESLNKNLFDTSEMENIRNPIISIAWDKFNMEKLIQKWSKGLNAAYKNGYPELEIPSVDPYVRNFEPFSIELIDSTNNSNRRLEVEVTINEITGLSDREVTRIDMFYSRTSVIAEPMVNYKGIQFIGNYRVLKEKGASTNYPSLFRNATGNFKYVIWGILKDLYVFDKFLNPKNEFSLQNQMMGTRTCLNCSRFVELTGALKKLENSTDVDSMAEKIEDIFKTLNFIDPKRAATSKVWDEVNNSTDFTDSRADELKVLKWSKGLNKLFKTGYPNLGSSVIDPFYNGIQNIDKTMPYLLQPPYLGTFNGIGLTMQLPFYSITGLSDRKIENLLGYFMKDTFASCAVTYNEIKIQGNYVLSSTASHSSFRNITGTFKYVLTGKLYQEGYAFAGKPKEKLVVLRVHYPYNRRHYDGKVEFDGLTTDLHKFVTKSERLHQFFHKLCFDENILSLNRDYICKSWKDYE